ncbi:MAG: hypothetical protein ACRDZ3_13305 [Acidimicrobiia bacterium]
MGTIGFGAFLLALGVFFLLDGRSENRFGRSVGRSAEGERIGGTLIAAAGMVMIALGVIVMIAGLFAVWL